jgi:hypothetical protein
VTDLPGIYDQLSYHALAQRVVDGHGFSFEEGHWPATRGGEPTAHWSYLYTLYLAAVYSLFGVQPLIARLIQAVTTGFLHTWLAWRVGTRVFGQSVGLLSAGFSAFYIYFFYYSGGLLTESFYFVGVLWTLDVALRIGLPRITEVRTRDWIELGLAVGVTALLRQVFLLAVPVIFLWVWWQRPESADSPGVARRLLRPKPLKGLGVATLVVGLLIAPWSVRNYRAFDTFVLLNKSAGFAFYWGNHPIHETSFVPLLPSYADLIPVRLLALNEGQLDRALLNEGLAIVRADPIRFAKLSISRASEYFKFWPSSESRFISNVSRVGSFGLFLPFMLYGIGVSLRNRAAILLLLFAAAYTGIHLLSWTLIRYRLPVDVVLLVLAARAASDLSSRVIRSYSVGTPVQKVA